MDDEDFDNNSPIGQLILHINKLCKKPQIDEELSKALNVFEEKVTRQDTYLKNGIFNINFSEAALFLQSCTDLYSKKVDLYWDQLLEFHTRLIEYEWRDQKEKGKDLNSTVIEKLEERRNRYKRKKKFKLTLDQDSNKVDYFIFDQPENEEQDVPFEPDEDLQKAWRKIELESSAITKIPRAVVKQQRLTYRMKNYYIMKNQDWDIYDTEDGEFNTKYSRVPGWHVIYHLFEYNTLGLLPDKCNTIATLRLCCYLRAQFMTNKKIPFNAPYSQYKEEYLAYKKKFLEEEAKKWQNMPLDTMADLRKQLDYLAQKEREEEENPPKKIWNIPPHPPKSCCGLRDCIECTEDNKSIITISDSLDNDNAFKSEIFKYDLNVSIEKLSKEVMDSKLSEISGFFEGSENNSCLLSSKDTSKVEQSLIETNCGSKDPEQALDNQSKESTSVDSTENVTVTPEGNNENVTIAETDTQTNCNPAEKNLGDTIITTSEKQNVTTNEEEKENIDAGNEEDNFDTRSVMSDHDYCQREKSVLKENSSNKKKTNDNKDVMVPMSTKSVIIPKMVPIKTPKEKKKTAMDPPSTPLKKQRKLSQKAIEKLLTSKITPVKEMKFEQFFTKNYQPQMGEGMINPVDYESSDDEEVSPETILAPDDDVRSIISDHNYSQLANTSDNPIDDSGFVDQPSELNSSNENNHEEINEEVRDILNEEQRDVDPAYQEEYERLLTQLRNSRGEMGSERIDLENAVAERQKKEQERIVSRNKVQQWKETITPIIKNLNEHDFNIHEYGTKIMEGMTIEEKKPFKKIVEGQTPAEAIRYFIASLQLANTYNIEICGAKQGEISNESFEVKLLKEERYHEHLAEYHAPSIDDFHEKVKRLREIQNQNTTERDLEEPILKRQRLEYSNKKKRKLQDTPSSPTTTITETPTRSKKQCSKNNYNETPNPVKGKNIVLRNVNSVDINSPSTSQSSFSSPLHITEEQFIDELNNAQSLNPDIFSSPLLNRPCTSYASSSDDVFFDF